ncbi:glycogen/starch synthase [Silvanigrella aquatica]|uniref:starch synthase n=1 Tax=Silvanigrella aquatica TaxID=1915309 RepID=A0A1L4D382_9BACT|nr:glycogen/starch synthase [Silvanigrella aquatica]APJ04654.1 hypothetical protein AXG55_12365 [Silvanigrella aquatica]
MKKKLSLIFIFLFFYSCSKNEEKKFEDSSNKIDTSFNTECLTKFKSNQPKNDYDKFINFILEKASKNNYYLKNNEVKFENLNDKELVKLYDTMQDCKGKGQNIFSLLNIETKDSIWRRALSNETSLNNFKNSLKKYNEFNFNNENVFFNLVKINPDKENFSNYQIEKIIGSHITKSDLTNTNKLKFKKLNVLQVSIEAHNVIIGGIGTVLNGLIKAQNQHVDPVSGKKDINAIEITPFYDILKRDNSGEYEFVGYVKNFLDNKLYTTTVYKIKTPSEITQYLVQPDPKYNGYDLFYLNEEKNLYGKMLTQKNLEYFSSSVAAIATLYHGKNGGENIDILHSHIYPSGFANVLVKKLYNPLRKKVGLPKIYTAMTVHGATDEKGIYQSNFLNHVGFEKKPSSPEISLHILSLIESDIINAVSKGVINSYISDDPNVSFQMADAYTHLLKINRFVGIANGIDLENFNPIDKKVLGSLHVAADLSDLAAKKWEAKKILYDAGIISSPTKPLFLYVGRFAPEKGMELFSPFVNYIAKHNGQTVIMGKIIDTSLNKFLDNLKNSNIPDLKIYTDVKNDQLKILSSVNASKGNLIRFASDFTFIPSIFETFGIIAVEGLVMGSNLITTNVQGLQDITIPYNPITKNIDTFNSVIFKRDNDISISSANMTAALDIFNQTWNTLTAEKKEEVQKRAIEYAQKFSWTATGGACDQYKTLYIKAMEPLSPDEKKAHDLFKKSYLKYGYQDIERTTSE